jgi:hypothetical protein
MESMDDGTENAEDGATLTTSIEEHQDKLEDKSSMTISSVDNINRMGL